MEEKFSIALTPEELKILLVFSKNATVAGFTKFMLEKEALPDLQIVTIGKPAIQDYAEIANEFVTLGFIQVAYEGDKDIIEFMYEYLSELGFMQ